jgi:hypothetical protein
MEQGINYDQEITLVRNNTFENNILIVDGQGRSGKNLIAVLLSTIPSVEKMRLDSQIDYIPRYFALGKLSKDAAITALRTEFDEKHYYNSISRDVNFRLSDYSGVFKQGERLKYILRLFQSGDEEAVKRLVKNKPIFQEMTHDALHLANFYFEALGSRLKIIHVLRDPVENIFEQNKRNFGIRIGSDPRELQLAFSYKGNVVPLLALGHEEEYLNGNPLERLVLIVDAMFRANLAGYLKLDEYQKSKVIFVNFDDFVVNPYPYLVNLEEFIGAKFGRSSKRILKRENCPRVITKKERDDKINQISNSLSASYRMKFEMLVNDYDSNPWQGL